MHGVQEPVGVGGVNFNFSRHNIHFRFEWGFRIYFFFLFLLWLFAMKALGIVCKSGRLETFFNAQVRVLIVAATSTFLGFLYGHILTSMETKIRS